MQPKTVEMLERLARNGNFYLWFKDETTGKSRTEWYGQGEIPKSVSAAPTEHVYFGVYPTGGAKTSSERAKVADITALNCLYAEYDGNKTYDEIMALPFKPSCVVESSPGKYHAYWFLNETIKVVDGNRKYYQVMIAKWVEFVGGDKASKDMARVLRLPGSRNVKAQYVRDDGSYPEVKMLWYDASLTYAEPDIMGVFTATESKARNPQGTKPLDGETQAALAAITSERWGEYDTWLRIGMALHSGGFGCEVWDMYSQQAPNYEPGVCEMKWATFTVGGNGVGIGTLHKIASECNPDWKRDYRKAELGKNVPLEILDCDTFAKAYKALCDAGVSIRWNSLSEQVEYSGLHSTNSKYAKQKVIDAGIPRAGVEDALQGVAEAFRYHPIDEYYKSLPTMSVDEAHAVIDLALSSLVTQHTDLDRLLLKKWLVGQITHFYNPEYQNVCPILYSKPDIGKTYFIRRALMPTRWVSEDSFLAVDKDTRIRTAENLVWFLDEIDQILNRASMAALKNLLTTRHTKERRAYARRAEERVSICSFIGATNHPTCLMDLTGNRRFWVMTVLSIDWNVYETVDKDTLWGAIHTLYQGGYDASLTPDLKAHQKAKNEEHLVENDVVFYLRECLIPSKDAFISSADLVSYIQSLTGDNAKGHLAIRVKEAMEHLGYQQVRQRIRGKHVRGYQGVRVGG